MPRRIRGWARTGRNATPTTTARSRAPNTTRAVSSSRTGLLVVGCQLRVAGHCFRSCLRQLTTGDPPALPQRRDRPAVRLLVDVQGDVAAVAAELHVAHAVADAPIGDMQPLHVARQLR